MAQVRIRARRHSAAARSVSALVALLMAFVVLFVAANPATAADSGGTVTGITLDKRAAASGEAVRVDFDWQVPDYSQPGDTFTIVLPNELIPKSTAAFNLTAADGSVIATGAWSGKTLTFTLTDYVTDNPLNVHGDGFFVVEWDRSVVSGEVGGDYDLYFGGSADETVELEFIPDGPPGTVQDWGKTGGWLDSDQGSVTLDDQIGWTLFVATQTVGSTESLVIEDNPGAGLTIDAATVLGYSRPTGVPEDDVALDSARYTVEQIGAGIRITVVGSAPGDPAVYPGETLYFTVGADLLPGNDGVFYNSVAFTADGEVHDRDAVVITDEAGGNGVSARSVTVGDFVWVDTDRDGIQDAGEPGIEGVELAVTGPNGPVVDVDGGAVGTAFTDASGAYLFTGLPALPRGEHYVVSIVQDSASTIQALAPYEPTVPGAGSDPAIDSATWTAESGDLPYNAMRDMTLDFGFVTIVGPSVTPVAPTVVQATCTDGGAPTAPTVTVAETDGITYAIDGDVESGSTVRVVATADEGYTLGEADGWVTADDGTASFAVVLVEVECPTPTPEPTPEPTPTPEPMPEPMPVAPTTPTTPTEPPSASTLPATGVSPLLPGGVALLLLLGGLVLTVRIRRS